MEKTFNLSYHRSGTKSFTEFATKLGFRALHWPGEEFDAQLEHIYKDPHLVWKESTSLLDQADVFSDLPWPFLYNEAAVVFPDAKFLFIKRGWKSWIKSVRKHTANRKLSWLERAFYFYMCGQEIEELHELFDKDLMEGYNTTLKTMRQILGKRLSVYSLEDPLLAEKLKKFLEVSEENKDVVFPHVLDQQQFLSVQTSPLLEQKS